MKIGIMGIGNIFSKAYLPILSQNQNIDWHFYSSSQDKLDDLERAHGFKYTFNDLESFYASGIQAIMIHTPTSTHYQLIKEALQRGLHVFVDKPISDQIEQTQELLELAESKGLILMVGFNRRFAPLTQKIKAMPKKSMIVVRKNRGSAQQEARFSLYDMMIHVVDTALYLLDEPIISHSHNLILDEFDQVVTATLSIQSQNTQVLAYMNMQSGARLETFEVMSPDGHAVESDLNNLDMHDETSVNSSSFSDWTPTLERRGFNNLIDTYIERIRNNDNSNNKDALLSHQMIEEFLSKKVS